MRNHTFAVCHISYPVDIGDRSVINDSQHLSSITFSPNLNVSNVSNRFNQFLIPALVFKNSALDGSNDKMWSKVIL